MANEQDAVASDAVAIDYDAISTQVVDKLKETFNREPVRQQYTPPAPPSPSGDPVKDLVDPYVQPHVQRAERLAMLAEEAATDAVEFHASHPDLSKEERAEIETRFRNLKAKGVPFKREDIFNHYLGENIDKVVDRKIKARQEAADRAANAATTVGAGSPDKAHKVLDAHSMSKEDLEKAMDGVLF